MQEEIFFEDVFKSLLDESKEFVIEYAHKMNFFKDEEYISYSIKSVNGCSSGSIFKSKIKKLCKEGLNNLKHALEKQAYEHRLGFLEYISDEFSQFLYQVIEKEKVDEESEWGPEERHKFIGFFKPKFIGTKGENPHHKDSIEHKAEEYSKSWLEAIEDSKRKIDFLIHQIELLPEPKSAIKDKNTIQIFYSWQSDNDTERRLIWKALRKVESYFKTLGKNIQVESDMRGVPGSQDIPNTLFKKIETSDIFLADVNLVNKSLFRENNLSPNPNVLIELGYAASKLGWERVILMLNTETNKIEDLPFDIRQRSVLWYGSDSIENLTDKLKIAINQIIK